MRNRPLLDVVSNLLHPVFASYFGHGGSVAPLGSPVLANWVQYPVMRSIIR